MCLFYSQSVVNQYPYTNILLTENANSSNYGGILTADHKSRLCQIKWFSREGQELSVERDVSVYDITEHADFVFSAGDVVVRVAKDGNENEAAEQGAARPSPCVGQVSENFTASRDQDPFSR